jgi:hypothetical protein
MASNLIKGPEISWKELIPGYKYIVSTTYRHEIFSELVVERIQYWAVAHAFIHATDGRSFIVGGAMRPTNRFWEQKYDPCESLAKIISEITM